MSDAILKVFLKVIGYPQAPKLLRRVPLLSKELKQLQQSNNNTNNNSISLLEGIKVKILTILNDSENNNNLNNIIINSGGNIIINDEKYDGIIFDIRGIDKVLTLNEVYKQLNPIIKNINKSGRIILISGDTIKHTKNIGAITVTEAIGGFAKALSQEVGGKGITVNALQIPTSVNLNTNSYESNVIQFFLSKRSAFITGQVIPVFHSQFNETGHRVINVDSTENFAPHNLTNDANNNNINDNNNSSSSSSSSSPSSRFSVQNKRVVITGAARGIGEYTSRLYAAEGAKVLLVDHPSMESQLKSLANELGGHYLALDVTNEKSPELLYDSIQTAFGSTSSDQFKLDIVVHNAGITRDKTFANMSEEQFRTVLDVNLASIIRIDDLLLCYKKGVIGTGGRLVYLSSIAGIAGGFGQTNYSCSKAGVVGYVASRAAEVSSRGIGINAIAPGFIETEMTKAIPFFIRNVGRRMNALNQGGYPADIAEAALFLSSEASKSLNGVTIRVCGKHRVGA